MAEFDGVIFSDLHLAEDKPRLNALFDAFVDRVEGTPEVACLGDLLEYCIGRKHQQLEHGRHVVRQMTRLAQPAKRAIWVSGNRDHMFSAVARKAGYDTYRNRYFGEFCGQACDLEHGDLFCTADREYQRYRRWFRNTPWGLLGALVSAQTAHRFSRWMSSKSKGDSARKDPERYGIQPGAVQRQVTRGARQIVCGHVHTPFSRNYAGNKEVGRLRVMSDWRENGAVVCVVQDGEFKLMWFDGETFAPFDAPEKQGIYQFEMAQ